MLSNLFPELKKHQSLMEDLSEQSQMATFEEGDVLLKDGGYAKFIPFVLKGLIKVYKEDKNGNEVLLYYINKGESCIMSATYCLQNQKSEVKAIVEEKAKVVLVPAAAAITFSRKYPGWNAFFFTLFQARYSDLLHIIQTLTFEHKDKRLLDYLRNEKDLKGSPILHITHQKIANDLGTTREVISRLLKKLEKEDLLTLEHKKIILHSDQL